MNDTMNLVCPHPININILYMIRLKAIIIKIKVYNLLSKQKIQDHVFEPYFDRQKMLKIY